MCPQVVIKNRIVTTPVHRGALVASRQRSGHQPCEPRGRRGYTPASAHTAWMLLRVQGLHECPAFSGGHRMDEYPIGPWGCASRGRPVGENKDGGVVSRESRNCCFHTH
jgi:hypothetical protein